MKSRKKKKNYKRHFGASLSYNIITYIQTTVGHLIFLENTYIQSLEELRTHTVSLLFDVAELEMQRYYGLHDEK